MSAPPARDLIANSQMAGRTCPYCRFPVKAGAPVVECGSCHAIHHRECLAENGGCAIAGCTSAPSAAGARPAEVAWDIPPRGAPSPANPHGGTAPPAITMPPPPPSSYPSDGARRQLAPAVIVALALVVLAGGALAYVATRQQGSQPTPTPARSGDGAAPAPSTPAASSGGTVSPPVSTPKSSTITVAPGHLPLSPTVTGQDAMGYNIGSGCSDNEGSPLPGCSDSPSTPLGDPVGMCPNGIRIDQQTTTCGLAENVRSSYTSDGSVTAFSLKTQKDYVFTCQTGPVPGTTGYTICESQDGPSTLYVRWHK
jgi:hypothetical protein